MQTWSKGYALMCGGVICLQYADNKILLYDKSLTYATKFKWVWLALIKYQAWELTMVSVKSELIPPGSFFF
jgi:hypothetical protein